LIRSWRISSCWERQYDQIHICEIKKLSTINWKGREIKNRKAKLRYYQNYEEKKRRPEMTKGKNKTRSPIPFISTC
jgi:hypothetical protein